MFDMEPASVDTTKLTIQNDVQAHALIADILHAQMMEELSTPKSIMLDAKVLGHEIIDHPHKIQAMGAAAVTLVTQVADHSRYLVAFLPEVAQTTYEHTQSPVFAGLSPVFAGLAVGATFTAWGMAVGEPLNVSVRKLPKTVENIGRTFPRMINMFESALPGIDAKTKTDDTQEKTMLDRIKKIGSSATSYLSKGFVAIGLGTTSYTLTSIARGDSGSETTKINARVSRDGGVVLAGLAAGLIGSVDWLANNGHEGTAHWLDDWIINNSYLWYGLAGAIVVANFAMSRIKRKDPLYFEHKGQLITGETPISDTHAVGLWTKIKQLIPGLRKAASVTA